MQATGCSSSIVQCQPARTDCTSQSARPRTPTMAGMDLPTPPNPYASMLPRELAAAAYRLVSEMAKKRARSPVERQELASRCGHLLGRLAHQIDPRMAPSAGQHSPGIATEQLSQGYNAWAQRECAAVRRQVLLRAAMQALGEAKGFEWVRWALESDAHLNEDTLRGHLNGLERAALGNGDDSRMSKRSSGV